MAINYPQRYDDDFLNTIKTVIDHVNVHGKTIQDLVAEGQLTEEQYAELITVINGLLKSGEVDKSALTRELRYEINLLRDKIDKGDVSINDLRPELLNFIHDGEGGPLEILSIPRNRSVSPEKTTFIETSSNLVEIKNVMYNTDIDGTTGEPIAVSGTSTLLNHFIPVEAGENYTFKRVNKAYVYDSSGNLIQDLGVYSASNPVTRTIGSTGAFCKLIVATDLINIQMNKGDTLLPYEPFYNNLSDSIDIDAKNLKGGLDASKFDDNSISADKVDFIEKSSNLLNVDNIEKGKSVSASSDGQLVDSNSWNVSELIKLPAGDAVTYHSGANDWRVAFYDSEGDFITTTAGRPSPGTASVPDDAWYARFNIYQEPSTGTPQINMGSEILPYEPYYFRLIGDTERTNEDAESEENIKNIDGYTIAGKLEGFYNQSTLPAREGGIPSQTANAYMDAYVSSHPHYVSRTKISESVEGMPIYRYDFNPNIVGDPDPETKFPKVFLICGTHGTERMSPEVANHFFGELCNNWENDELLETLRWNVHFIVIPMLNPDGWGASTRGNANGVDLNRQFPTGWSAGTPGTSTYGGTAPLTEPEAIAVNEILENEEDLIYVCDFHNFSVSETPFWFIWNAGGTKMSVNLGKTHVSQMTRKWKEKYSWFPQDETTIVGRSSWTPNGSIAAHGAELGIQSSTYEVGMGITGEPEESSYSSNTMTLATEAFTNWILLNVKNNIDS